MKPTLIMHVNYCEQGQTLEEICAKAVDWGFDGVEFRRHRSGVKETEDEYLENLAKAKNKTGLKNVLFGYPTADFMQTDATQRQKELESALEFYRKASKSVQMPLCNAFSGALFNPDKSIPYPEYEKHGSAVATDDQWKWTVDGFRVLGAEAEKTGFRFAFETHMGYLHDRPLVTGELVKRIGSPAIGVNLDFGNAVYMKNNPPLKETIETLKESIFYVHLKNSISNGSNPRIPTALSDGEINHREYLRLLKNQNYTGPICIEAPRPGDREWYAKQDLAYVNSLLNDLQWK